MTTEMAQMTLHEAARALAGIAPFLPPQMAQVVAQVVNRALQAEGERESLQVQTAAAREQLDGLKKEIAAAAQQRQGMLQAVEQTQGELRKLREEEASLERSLSSKKAMLAKADELVANIQKYITLFRP